MSLSWQKRTDVLHLRIDRRTKVRLEEQADENGKRLSSYLYELIRKIAYGKDDKDKVQRSDEDTDVAA